MHQSTSPSFSQTSWPRLESRQFLILTIVQTMLPVTFGYSLSSEAVVMRQLRRWKCAWRRSLTRSHKRTSMGPSRGFCNGTTSALQSEEITLKGTWVSCVYYQEKCPYEKKVWKLILWSSYNGETLLLKMQNFYCFISKYNATIIKSIGITYKYTFYFCCRSVKWDPYTSYLFVIPPSDGQVRHKIFIKVVSGTEPQPERVWQMPKTPSASLTLPQ